MRILLGGVVALAVLMAVVASQAPAVAAGGLLYPMRRHVVVHTPPECVDFDLNVAEAITLRGWRCKAKAVRRGTVVYLHGVADSRASAAGAVKRLTDRGFDVVAYDSRAHGQSTGEMCTYGYFEKDDLSRVIDTIEDGRVVLFGHSLGAAVALQTAAEDPRVAAVVSVESFSDLRTIAGERAFFLPSLVIDRAFRYAEERAHFEADRVSPVAAAARITVPVLVIHGKEDDATSPAHSERIFQALGGPKRIILVNGARHNQSLAQPEVWQAVERWIDGVFADEQARPPAVDVPEVRRQASH